jgi:solute carrier family 25, member 39/40
MFYAAPPPCDATMASPSIVCQSSHYSFSNGLMDTMLPKERLLKRCRCTAADLCNHGKSTSLFRTMARIARLEGPLALYAGLPPTLLIAVPSTAMYFLSYEAILRQFQDALPNQNVGSLAMVAGGVARAGSATVFSPLEVIRVQMQASTAGESFLHHLQRVVSAGPRQLCAGLGATLARDIPFSMMYWYGIETSKPMLHRWLSIENPNKKQVTVALLAGMMAGTLATVVTHPFDVVKTRAQVAMYATTVSTHHRNGRPRSSVQMLQRIWREEGLRGMAAGLTPRVAKVAPACAIMISSYEAGKILFHTSQ